MELALAHLHDAVLVLHGARDGTGLHRRGPLEAHLTDDIETARQLSLKR